MSRTVPEPTQVIHPLGGASECHVMHATDLQIQDPSPSDLQFLEDRLYEFNKVATGITDGRDLGIFIRNEEADIVAGAAGHTWGGTCELRQVWVSEALRGQGVGRRLIAMAEAEAIQRDCRQLVLTTHSFQAPKFYEKLGFQVVSAIPDYPLGHSELVFRKLLQSSTEQDA